MSNTPVITTDFQSVDAEGLEEILMFAIQDVPVHEPSSSVREPGSPWASVEETAERLHRHWWQLGISARPISKPHTANIESR
jgi:hypothetical protein